MDAGIAHGVTGHGFPNGNNNLHGYGNRCERLHRNSDANHHGEYFANCNRNVGHNNHLQRIECYAHRKWSKHLRVDAGFTHRYERYSVSNRNNNVYGYRNCCERLHGNSNAYHHGEYFADGDHYNFYYNHL